jgi:hypothetical protein
MVVWIRLVRVALSEIGTNQLAVLMVPMLEV